ncbi:MAG: SMI1/KNR4 family protein [Eubacteriaceae bacterium]|nr:SMI1/KNR4 family protein [Eubacteriaceae bacterium]
MEKWRDNIVVMIYVKQEIMKLDVNKIWPHHFPEVAATEKEINKAESYLGFKLDSYYREFLKAANGWKGFYQTVDLFGTNEFCGMPIMEHATSMLSAVEDNVIKSIGFSREELIPIAATDLDKDLFVMSRPSSHEPGVVIWLAGEEVERYKNFEEYFLAMIDYNRLMIKLMQDKS